MDELDAFRKEYGRKRRTAIENAEEAVFEEKKIEEQEVVFLMDRFGYAKTVDVSVYERNREAADSENKLYHPLHEYREDLHFHGYGQDAPDQGPGSALWEIPG